MAMLNASNACGYSDSTQSVNVLTVANFTANTTIYLITITSPYVFLSLVFILQNCPFTVIPVLCLFLHIPLLSSNSCSNITFLSSDRISFQPLPIMININISVVIFKTNEINLSVFS